MKDKTSKAIARKKAKRLLDDTIDVTGFLINFIEKKGWQKKDDLKGG